jgi:hypothetical protein
MGLLMPVCDEFDLFTLYNGGRTEPLRVGEIPHHVRAALGWRCAGVFLTRGTTQKARFSKALDFALFRHLPTVIAAGAILQDRNPDTDLVFTYSNPRLSPRCFFVAARRDRESNGIMVRTFFMRATLGRKHRSGRFLRNHAPIEAVA